MTDRLHDYPDLLGPYRITGVLGHGATAVVYAGEGPDGERVAIKRLLSATGVHRDRFQREVEAMGRLRHPGIVRIRAVGEHEAQAWFAMDYLGQVNLRDVIECNGAGVLNELAALATAIEQRQVYALPPSRRRQLPERAALELMVQVCEAVSYAHARGVIHRDLKPENIQITADGAPVLVDFGLAADRASRQRLTATGAAVGTLAYMAPEQMAGEPGDERSDIYALGVMTAELLSGWVPDPVHHVQSSMRVKRLTGPALVVVRRASHRLASHRYRTVEALAADLTALIRGEPVRARPDPIWQRSLGLVHRNPRHVATLVVAAVLTFALSAGVTALLRLETSAWGEPLVTANWPDQTVTADTVAGAWAVRSEGMAPVAGIGGAHALAVGPWLTGAVRLEFEITTGPAPLAEMGVFIASRHAGSDGYRLQCGAYGNAGMLLLRGDEILWAGGDPLPPSASVSIAIELVDDVICIERDGRQLAMVTDPTPVAGGRAGLFAWRQFGDPTASVAVTSLRLVPRTLPELEDPTVGLTRLRALHHSADGAVADAVWRTYEMAIADAARSATASAADQRVYRRWLVQALLSRRQRAELSQHEQQTLADALAAMATEATELADHRLLARAYWHDQPAQRPGLFAPLAQAWRAASPAERSQQLPWLLDLAVRDGHAVALVWIAALAAEAPPTSGLAQWLLAQRVLSYLAWHPQAGTWALDTLAPMRGADTFFGVLIERLDVMLQAAEHATQPTGHSTAAVVFGAPLGDDAKGVDWASLALGQAPTPTMRRIRPSWMPLEQRRIKAMVQGSLPPLSCHTPGLSVAAVRAVVDGSIDSAALFEQLSLAGEDPSDVAWGRLLAARLLISGDHAVTAAIPRFASAYPFDALVLGLVWRRVHGLPIDDQLLARSAPAVAQALRALRGEVDPRAVSLPDALPGRPFLEVLLAERLAAIDTAAGQVALRAVVDRWPGAPGALVAQHWLEHGLSDPAGALAPVPAP